MSRPDDAVSASTRSDPVVGVEISSALDDPRVLRATEEYAELLRAGPRPDRQAFLARHADIAEVLARCLDGLEFMHVAGHNLSRSAGQGPSDGTDLLFSGVPLGDFRLIREVGRGGMGIVYEAEQLSLGRRVALKVLPFAATMDPKQLQRFHNEAKAAAGLHHEHIVPVYGVGCERGVHYYAMQLIDGSSLARLIPTLHTPPPPSPLAGDGRGGGERAPDNDNATGPYQPAEDAATDSRLALSTEASGPKGREFYRGAARLIAQAADALEHAHGLGIVHRDIKPGNLLVDGTGKLWVTDFGLARFGPDAGLTMSGDLLGTLRYMAPEQALARHGLVDHRADVYALGATLYELLTGRPAVDAADRAYILRQIAFEDPTPLRKRDKAIPVELETITLKALAKNPAERYASAQDLADDLRRFMEDRPIRARRVSAWERGRRWCRRNPLPAGMTALILLLTLSGIGGILWQWQKADRAWREAEVAREDATAKAEAEREAREARERTLTDLYTATGLTAGARDDPGLAVLWFAHAAARAGDDAGRAEANRMRAETWGREAFQPVAALPHAAEWIQALAFHPDGHHLITHGRPKDSFDGDCTVWDLARSEPVALPGLAGPASAAAWSPDGQVLSLGTPAGEILVSRFPGGEIRQRFTLPGRVHALAYSANGRFLAAAAGPAARVWDCQTGAFATPVLGHPQRVDTLSFSPTGDRLATGCEDNTARLFAVPGDTAQPHFPPVPHRGTAGARPQDIRIGKHPAPPVFLPDGRRLLTSTFRLTLRDTRSGNVLQELGSPGTFGAAAVSPDGKYFALGMGRVARLYNAETGQVLGTTQEHRAQQLVMAVAFSPDGQVLVTASSDHTVRRWSVPDGKPLGGPFLHPTALSRVAFSPNGRFLATAQRGGLVRVWALPARSSHDYRIELPGRASLARISRDGRYVVPSSLNSAVRDLRSTRAYDIATGAPAGPPLELGDVLLDAAFSPDGRLVATACASMVTAATGRSKTLATRPGTVRLWDWRTGQPAGAPLALPSEPRALDFSPDGQFLAVACADGKVVIIDPATGSKVQTWQAYPELPEILFYYHNGSLRFGPNGHSLVTWGADAAVRVWDAATGQLRYPALTLGDMCQCVDFSPDGRYAATSSWDNFVRVWDFTTGRLAADPLPHPDWAITAAFTPDGGQLLTACRDGLVRLWDWRAGRLAVPACEHDHETHAVAVTPDGRWLLTVSDDHFVRVWDRATGRPRTPPLPVGGLPLSVEVTPDSRYAVVGGQIAALEVLDLGRLAAPSAWPTGDLTAWGQLLSGRGITDGGGINYLTSEQWLKLWRDFRARHPDPGGRVLAELAAWHRREAAACERGGLLFGARFHLDRLIATTPDDAPLYARRGTISFRSRQYEAAERDFTRAIGLGLGDYEIRFSRATTFMQLGRWEQAAADLERAVASPEAHSDTWKDLARVQARVGNLAGYRHACATLAERYLAVSVNERVYAELFVLAPDSLGDPARVVDLVQRISSRSNGAGGRYSVGAAFYRAGRFEDAVKALTPAKPEELSAKECFVLGIAHQRLGRAEQARQLLSQGLAKMEQARDQESQAFTLRCELETIRREAEALIQGGPAKPGP